MKRVIFLVVLTALFPASGCAQNWTDYDSPESIQADPQTGAYYITNVAGKLDEKDSNGYLSKITANKTTVIQKYIGGTAEEGVLDAPKGLLIFDDYLYVADLDKVKMFEKDSGRLLHVVDLAAHGCKFANDIAMDAHGVLYVSDTVGNTIYKIDPKDEYRVSIFVSSPALGGPNGMVVNPRNDHLIVVTWDGGEILEIEPQGDIHRLKRGLRRLDGVDYDIEGNLYVSSVERGEIYRIPYLGRGVISIFLGGLDSPADISCDRKRHELLIPSLNGHKISIEPLFRKEKKNLSPAVGSKENKPDQK